MHSSNNENNVTSIESLESSIRSDGNVRRWFTFLIKIPAIQSQLITQKNCAALYQNLKENTLWLNLLIWLLLILFFGGALLHQKITLLVIALLLWPLWLAYSKNKDLVAKISRLLIERDFQEDWLRASSLYQIGEYYSRTYRTPSLVDHIYALDMLTKCIFFIFVLYEYIEPHKTIVSVALFAAAYFAILGLLRIKHLYEFLNKLPW